MSSAVVFLDGISRGEGSRGRRSFFGFSFRPVVAGELGSCRGEGGAGWVYPRGRGGTFRARDGIALSWGLSPRARGNLIHLIDHDLRKRGIHLAGITLLRRQRRLSLETRRQRCDRLGCGASNMNQARMGRLLPSTRGLQHMTVNSANKIGGAYPLRRRKRRRSRQGRADGPS